MAARFWRAAALIGILALPGTAGAVPGPVFHLAEAVSKAALIVQGQVIDKVTGDLLEIEFHDRKVPARPVRFTLSVECVLKGSYGSGTIEVLAVEPEVLMGYLTVAPDDYGIFFLKERGQVFELADPNYPSVPGAPGVAPTRAAPYDRVVEQVAAVVISAGAPSDEKRLATHVLWGTKDSVARRNLRLAVEDPDFSVSLGAAAALLAEGDLSALSVAESALMHPYVGPQSEALHNIRVAIAQGVRAPAAIPELARLVAGGDVETRRAASEALAEMRDSAVVAPLVAALDDSDREVRYNAVVGLAKATGQAEWGPSPPRFMADEGTYIQHWKAWSKKR